MVRILTLPPKRVGRDLRRAVAEFEVFSFKFEAGAGLEPDNPLEQSAGMSQPPPEIMNRILASLRPFLIALGLIALPLLILFRGGFSPAKILFANDTPFGLLNAQASTATETFTGHWRDLNWVGKQEIDAFVGPTQAAFFGLGSPTTFAKWHALVALLFLGLSAWFYCRRSGFHPAVGVITGVAAALNSNAFSYACWGLSPKCYAFGFVLLALGALQPGPGGWRQWVRVVLAGFAVGLNVTEGADVGAILSLYVAASVVWETLARPGRKPADLTSGIAQLAVVAMTAAWIGAQSVQSLTGFAIKDVQGMDKKSESSAERWDYITGWSFPKLETLRLAVPGLLGYRMDTPDGGAYWGNVGADGTPQARFSGSGEYVGILVLLIAGWGVARSLSKASGSPYSEAERRRIWFWTGAAFLSLLLAYGRFFPLFKIVFALPFLSTIRIPMKYLHALHISVLVLFAHGLEGLARAYLSQASQGFQSTGMIGQLQLGWARATGFDALWKKLAVGIAVAAGGSALLYSVSGSAILANINAAGFKGDEAKAVLRFSLAEVWTAVAFLGAGLFVLLLIASRGFQQASRAFWILGLLVAVDLFRADLPWVQFYDKDWKYQTNPVIERLQAGTADHSRVTARIYPIGRDMLSAREDNYLPAVHNLWIEHHFQFYRIPTLDIIQMPRTPVLDGAYLKAFAGSAGGLDPKRIGRLWQLTSTRYVLGALPVGPQLTEAFAPAGTRFNPVLSFSLQPKPGITEKEFNRPESHTAAVSTNGPYAIFEFTGALPRATVLSRWTVETNNDKALERIVDPIFDPTREVVLSEAPTDLTASSESPRGEATITVFKPRQITVQAKAPQAGILLLNDRWHEHWHATVDGKPAPLLRANFLMRGVALPAGEHTVEFRFDPPHGALSVTLSAVAVGAVLLLALAFVAPKPAAPKTP